MTKIVSLLRFYYTICLPNLIITWIVTQKIIEFEMRNLKMFIFFKIIGILLILFFKDLRDKKKYLYYSNLGLTRKALLGYTFIVDMTFFFLILILSFQLC